MTSIGTSTSISVPGIFSSRGKDYDVNFSNHEENLLDIMKQVGFDILWLENDNGCKGVCGRVETIKYNPNQNEKLCDGKYCFDEIMMEDFKNKINKVKKDTLIVMHTIGSHGPTYYARYPQDFKKFTPTCDTSELQNCPQENIINSYDNTILYTDYFLNKVIEILKKSKIKTTMLYVSDHGESLGENGVYLHGMPYSIAPMEQKQVPFIIWSNRKIKVKPREIHQREIYSSVLEIGNVKSKTYDDKSSFIEK
jgi:lipid A ethanolaminephosphotransferase